MTRTWSIILNDDERILQMMMDSRSIYDQALYHQRQSYFKTKDEGKIKTYNYKQLYELVSASEQFNNAHMDYVAKQYTIKQVCAAWTAYIRAIIAYKEDPSKFEGEPKLPGYLYKKDKKYNLVQFDKTRLRKTGCKENEIRLPNSSVIIKLPETIKRDSVREITISKHYNKIKVNVIYTEDKYIDNSVRHGGAVGVDIGVGNLMAVTSNDKPFSYVVNGRPLVAINQFYNKRRAELYSMLDSCNKDQKSSRRLNRLELKRKNKIAHYMHCVSKQFLDFCVAEGVETIVIGHNDGWKQEVNLGYKTNQKFVCIPFNNLIQQIVYKAERYLNINVVIVEESYTSKTDHLALETMCKHETYKGKRVKRGLFKSSTGKVLNADINGAIGMLRKGNAISDDQLMILRDRGDVVSPRVFKLNL